MFSTISEYIFGKSVDGVSEDAIQHEDPQEPQVQNLENSQNTQQLLLSTSAGSEMFGEEWEVVSMQEIEEQEQLSASQSGSNKNDVKEMDGDAEDSVVEEGQDAAELARENYLIEFPCSDITIADRLRRPTALAEEANEPTKNEKKMNKKSQKLVNLNSKKDRNVQLKLRQQKLLAPLPLHDNNNHWYDGIAVHAANSSKTPKQPHQQHKKYGKKIKSRNDNFHYMRKSNVNNDRKCGKMQY